MKVLTIIWGAVFSMVLLGTIANPMLSQERLTYFFTFDGGCPEGVTLNLIDNNRDGFVDHIELKDCDYEPVQLQTVDQFGMMKHKNLFAKQEFNAIVFYDESGIPLAMLGENKDMAYMLIEPLPTAYYYTDNKVIFGLAEIDMTEFPNYNLPYELKPDFEPNQFDLSLQSFPAVYSSDYVHDFYMPNLEKSMIILDEQNFEVLYEKDYGLLEEHYIDFYKLSTAQSGFDFDFDRIDFSEFYKTKTASEFVDLLNISREEFNLASIDFALYMKNGFDERNYAVYNLFAFNLNDQDFKHLYCKNFEAHKVKNQEEFQLCRQLIEDAIKAQFTAEQLAMVEKFTTVNNENEKNYLRVSPNPVSSIANIYYEVDAISRVVIRVYSSVGYEEAVIIDEYAVPGSKQVSFNVSNLSNGVYVLQMIIDSRAFSTRLIVAN